jgi:phytoene dehydrogenase-like protein
MEQEHAQVAVIGAGLAGLAAAATAARSGARVVILDSASPGGRARTDTAGGGFRFNRGPHALYAGGPGRRVLARLGVRPATHIPPLLGSRVTIGGRAYPLLSRHVLGPRSLARVTASLAQIARTDPADCAGRSASAWIAGQELPPRAAAMLETLVRATSYVADLEHMSADLAVGQLRTGFRGVGYPDDGWQALVDGLLSRAAEAGAVLRPRSPVTQTAGEPGAWRVRLLNGDEITAGAVVVAAGTPAAARRLLPADPGWGEFGPEVTAACLDLGVRHTRARVTFGVDEPLYLSPHAPAGRLAPPGHGMVHVMRYGARTAAADRARLEQFAAAAGVGAGDVAVARFLPRMTVVTHLPAPGAGLAGRPPVTVPGAAGLFVAGDWAGPEGWLAGCSLASGEQAGQLAARAALAPRGATPAGLSA